MQTTVTQSLRLRAPFASTAVVLVLVASACMSAMSLRAQESSLDGGPDEFDSRKAGEWGKLLSAAEVRVRKQAIYALWVIGRHASAEAPKVAAALRDSDPYVRDVAGKALERMGEAAVATLPSVIDLLESKEEETRHVAARLCSMLGAPGDTQVARLAQSAKSDDAVVRAGVAGALGLASADSKPAREALNVLLEDAEESVARRAAAAIARQDPVAGLKDERVVVRAAATAAQQHPGPRDGRVVSALIALLHDSEEEIRARAASSLGMPGVLSAETATTESVRALKHALARKGETTAVQAQLIYALGRAAAWQGEALDAVIQSIEHGSGDARFAAVLAVGWSGRAGSAATLALAKCSSDQDPRVRAGAVRSLASIAPTGETATRIEKALFDQDQMVRVAAADSLGVLGKAAESAMPAMTKCMKAGTDRATLGAIAGTVLGIGAASDELLAELRRQFDSEKRPPARIAFALLRLEPEAQAAVVARVAGALLSEPEHYPGLDRVAQIGPRCALLVGPLKEGLKSPERKTRMMAARALGAIRGVVPEVEQPLRASLNDPDPEVREAVEAALGDK